MKQARAGAWIELYFKYYLSYQNYHSMVVSSRHCDRKIDYVVIVAMTCVPPYRSAIASIVM
jgi:hypothetical protein